MIEEKENRRHFLGPDGETLYYITLPSAEDIRKADWQYSKSYTMSLVAGITTAAEMTDILMRRGIIGPEFEQRANELARKLNEKIVRLEETETIEEKRALAVLVYNAREELYQWNQRLNGPMANTCEQIADNARLEYLTSCIIEKADGTKVWDSYDSFLKEKNNQLAIQARLEVMLFTQGFDSDFLEKTPEALAMKEVEADVMAKAEEAIKAIEAAAAEKEIEEKTIVKEKTTKKITSKKSTKRSNGKVEKEG